MSFRFEPAEKLARSGEAITWELPGLEGLP